MRKFSDLHELQKEYSKENFSPIRKASIAWGFLGDVSVNDDDEIEGDIHVPFMGVYQSGSDRLSIWQDIEEMFEVSIYEDLMFPLKGANVYAKENGWVKIDWDGNPLLGYKCFRKDFGRGHVSVGIGTFFNVVFSYGPNSDRSYSSTRHRVHMSISEKEAMCLADKNNGESLG